MPKGRRSARASLDARALLDDPLLWVAQGLTLLEILLVTWSFDPSASDAFALPKSAISHAITLGLGASLVLLVARHGRAFLAFSPLIAAAGVLVSVFAISTVFAMDTTVALYGAWRRYLGLAQVLDNFVLLVSVALVFRTTADRAKLLLLGLVAVVPVVAYSFLQRAGVDIVVYRNAPNATVSTLGQPDILGAFASIAAITAFASGALLWHRLGATWRAVILIVGVLALVAAVLTGVRAGALGLAAGWIAIVTILRMRPRAVGPSGMLWVVGGAGVALLAVLAISPIGQRIGPSVLAADPAIRTRLEIWDTAWKILVAHPILGVGPDNFVNAYPAMRSELSELLVPGELQSSTHSWFWYAATSAGALGLTAMVGLAALALARGVELARRGRAEAIALVPLAAYLGQGLVGVNDLSLDWVLWVSAGILVSSDVVASAQTPRRWPTRVLRPANALAAVVLVTVIAFGVSGTVSRVGGSRVLGLAQAYLDLRVGPPAVPLAQAVVATDPRRSEHWANYGTALSLSGSDAASVEAFTVATKLDPTYPNHWRNLAIELGRLGNIPGAYAATTRAVAADRWSPDSLDLLAQLALSRGDADLAATSGAEAVKLDPTTLSRYDAPILADLSLQRFGEAERLLTEAFQHGGDTSSLMLYRRAQLYAATGRVSLAIADLDRAIALDPKNADAVKLRQDLSR